MAMSFFGLRAKLSAGALAVVGIGVTIDTTVNYTKTDAVVTGVETDCFIKAYKRELVEKDTSTLAYMPCEEAPLAAEAFGYNASNIHKRNKVSYRYVSPVDKQAHTDVYNNESDDNSFQVGQVYRILAHKKTADKSQWGFAGKPVGMANAALPTGSANQSAQAQGLRGKL
jgi:hypothetical protein